MQILEHDACTQTTINRQASPAEQQAAAVALAEMQQQAETFQERIDAKNGAIAKLKALGLTDEEIAALVGD